MSNLFENQMKEKKNGKRKKKLVLQLGTRFWLVNGTLRRRMTLVWDFMFKNKPYLFEKCNSSVLKF